MKINIVKIKEFFEKVPRILAENIFVATLIFIFMAVALGGIVFYKYDISLQRTSVTGNTDNFVQFKEKSYLYILEEWQIKEKNFGDAKSRQYPNPFTASSSLTK